MSNMNDPDCILCHGTAGRPGEEVKPIQERAIATLIESSKARGDKKYVTLQKLTTAHAHFSCQKKYNNKSAIDAAVAEHAKKCVEGKQTIKEAVHFDFHKLCLFCAKVCDTKRKYCLVERKETTEKIMTNLKKRENTEMFDKNLFVRLDKNSDLVKVQARYHEDCIARFYTKRLSNQLGRPPSKNTTDFIEYIVYYIEENATESQFSLNEIKKDFGGDEFPSYKTIKSNLDSRYPGEIEFLHPGKDHIILFRHKISKEDWTKWHKYQENKLKDSEDERRKIVEMAGKIILEDIRNITYDKTSYTLPNFNRNNIFDNIPESLTLLLEIIIQTHKNRSKTNDFKWKKRIATVAHSIITSTRPRSFLSPILLGLSSMMHKKYASRDLIDSLSYLGLCASYDETLRFEASVINDPENHTCNPTCFVQYVFDNADHNTCTLDGKNTMHVMGGIKVATPSSDVLSKKTIARLSKIPSSEEVGSFGFIKLREYPNKLPNALKEVLITNVCDGDSKKIEISMEDFTWLYSKHSNKKSKGYSGFMEDAYVKSKYKTSKIIPLPFVNNPPSDLETIFTVLVKASEETRDKFNQKICFVTFDQPLYQKARCILSCVDPTNDKYGLANVRVRLGGFHTLMSFLGSIGYIMDGSGLKEAFASIYAENSAEKAFSGHAYSRSIRAHFLVQVALATIIFDSLELDDEETATFNALLECLGNESFIDYMNKEEFVSIKDKFMHQIEMIEEKGPTAQLWIQYWNMLAIVKDFIKAERSGDWDLHLKGIRRMIPYFHASGHNNYAKSAHLYLQDMLELRNDMGDEAFENFVQDSLFTIRRSEKFWSGVWSDMTIEQVLMRSIHTQGGLTHGRNPTESVCTKFLLTMIVLVDVCNEMEDFCNVCYHTSEQHVDSSESRIARDVKDLEKLLEFFELYNPFPQTQYIMSIFSGIVGNLEGKNAINCHKAFEHGLESLQEIVGGNFADVKYKRTNKVRNLKSIQSSVNIHNEIIPLDPLLLFQRLCANITDKTDMKKYLEYELSPFPLSIFTETGFRKNTKSELFDLFNKTTLPAGDIVHVIDGGFLLHRVVWKKNDTVQVITNKYLDYVRKHYAKRSCIVFDGYPENKITKNTATTTSEAKPSTTKATERARRKNILTVPSFVIEPHTKITFSQSQFLSNEQNKIGLIKELKRQFTSNEYSVAQAVEDADSLIINTAIEESAKYKIKNATTGVTEYKKTVVVIGTDIDLLVLLNQLNSKDAKIYFVSPGVADAGDLVYSSNSFKFSQYRDLIGFLHSFSGCDTTSGFAGKGKKTIVNSLIATPGLSTLAKPFNDPCANPKVLVKNGCELIKSIYNCQNKKISLDDLRFLRYKSLVKKSTFKLHKLPPTVGTATQHILRAYFQLQVWRDNDEILATDWGWKEVIVDDVNILMPRLTDKQVIPDELLVIISCGCEKTNCSSQTCGCRKLGLKCTDFCQHCPDESCCSNLDEPSQHLSESEDELDEREQPMLSLNSNEQLEEEESDDEMIYDEESDDQESNNDASPLAKKARVA